MSKELFQKAIAEAIGTFGLVFIGCGSMMVSARFPGSIHPGSIPVIFGLVVAVMIYSLGHISGAHFNPAVTLGFAAIKRFPWKECPAYWCAQFLGAFFAMFLLWLLLPSGSEFGATVPKLSVFQSLGWETVLTFFLMFVITAVATDSRAVGIMAGAAIGATITFGSFVGGVVTGASMNPARSLAPAVFQGEINSLWIYFVGPAIGAVLAAVLYEKICCHHQENKDAKGCC